MLQKRFLTVFFAFAYVCGFAQLSGTYTVGGTSPSYATLSEAVDSLHSQGVSGSVVFNIRPGNYNEQILLDSIVGTSATKTVTFQTQPASVSRARIYFSSLRTVDINGSDYVVFKNLELEAQGTSNSVVDLRGYSESITIDSCKLVKTASGSAVIDNLSGDTNLTHHLIIKKNEVHCADGAFFYALGNGTAKYEFGCQIIDNDVYNLRGIWGMRIVRQDSISIIGNYLEGPNTTGSQSTISVFNDKNFKINYNEILANTSGSSTGIFCNGSSGGIREIIGNSYTNRKSSSAQEYGIEMPGLGSAKVYYNTIELNSTLSTGIQTSGSNNEFKNNNISNNGGGYTYECSSAPFGLVSNHNNLYSTNDTIIKYGSTFITSLSQWQSVASVDVNSYSVDPLFESDTVLKPTTYWLNDAGTTITGITKDITGGTRGSSPDIGAYEFFAVDPRLTGTYTIGGTSPDYANFSAAVAALDSHGVKGPVTFNVRSNTYNEQIELDSIAGASYANTITFQKDPTESTKPILSFTPSVSKRYVILINGADYVQFKNLEIKASGSFSRVITFVGETDSVRIDSCHIISSTSTTNSNSIPIFHSEPSNGTANYCSVTNSTLENGYMAIQMIGTSSEYEKENDVVNNLFLNQYTRGIIYKYQKDLEIKNNDFRMANTTAQSTAIFLQSDSVPLTVSNNKLRTKTTGSNSGGIYISFCKGTSTDRIEIFNNYYFNEVGKTSYSRGFSLLSCSYLNFFHNTSLVRSSDVANGFAATILGGNDINFRNNNLANIGGGYALFVSSAITNISANYNNYYSSGSAPIYYSSAYSSVPAFTTARNLDTNSVSYNPIFTINDSILPTSEFLDNLGEIGTGITTDISGKTRGTSPDIGASEFTGVANRMSGTYTVGTSLGKDFTSPLEALVELQGRGMSGSVTFNIESGTYTGQLKVDSIIGSSSVNTLTIQKDPTAVSNPIVEFSAISSISPQTILVDGSDYVTFKNLDVRGTGSFYGQPFLIKGNTVKITIDSCSIKGVYGSNSASTAIYFTGTGGGASDSATISNCSIDSCYSGIYFSGTFGKEVKGNKILNNTCTNYRNYGMQLLLQEDFECSGNSLSGAVNNLQQVGLDFTRLGNNCSILSNSVINNTTSVSGGVYLSTCAGSSTEKITVANNTYQNPKAVSGSETGVFLLSSSHVDLYFNTISIQTSSTTSGIGLYLNTGNSNINVKNNILVNTGGGIAYRLQATPSNFASDYNNLFVTGNHIGYRNGSNLTDLATWKSLTSVDANSVSINPLFVATDTLKPNNGLLNNLGTPITGISKDIVGVTRNTTTPDIGAYEFTGIAPPLDTVYTIGGTTPDYPTIDSALSDLHSRGISAPVTFHLRPGTYNEQVTIGNFSKSFDTLSVTFKTEPNASALAHIKQANSTIIIDSGASYISFDSLLIEATTKRAVSFEGDNHHISFNHDSVVHRLTTPNGAWSVFIKEPAATVSVNDLTIANCYLYGGSNMISLKGTLDSNLTIRNNSFFGMSATPITLDSVNNVVIEGNDIQSRFKNGSNSPDGSSRNHKSIILEDCNNYAIERNYIYNESTAVNSGALLAQAINLINSHGTSTNHAIVANNVVTCPLEADRSDNYAARIQNSNYVDVVFNTFYGRTVDSNSGSGLVRIEGGITTFKNNIVHNQDSGYALYTTGTNHTLSHNNLYGFKGTRNIHGSMTQGTGGLNLDPEFNYCDNFIPRITGLESAGTPITGITTDFRIDTIRSTSAPSIGAYEYKFKCEGLSGTYTIGGTNPDYTTISEAVEELNCKGICDDVTFNIRQGTFNEQLVFEEILNAGDSGTVTFQADSSNTSEVLIQHAGSTAEPYVVLINDADYVEFKNLTIERAGTSSGSAVLFELDCEHIVFDSCRVKGSSVGSSFSADLDINNPATLSHLLVQNCTITKGLNLNSHIPGTDSAKFIGNTILDGGLSARWFKGSTFIDNDIDGVLGLSFGSNSLVARNYLNAFIASSGSNNQTIRNNEIVRSSGGGAMIISSSNNKIYFNSVTSNLAALDITGSNNDFKNNIFYSEKYCLELDSSKTNTFDYNVYYSEIDTLAEYNTGGFATKLSDLVISGSNANSLVLNPRFRTDTALVPRVPDLETAGTPISGVSTDIDSNLRGTTNPSIGAYEYTYVCDGLSGTYTVGGTSPTFTTIKDAVDSLNQVGICGDVTFNIRPATYEESIVIEDIYNIGDSGMVTFQNDPSKTGKVILFDTIPSAANALVELNGNGYVRFMGIEFNGYSPSNLTPTIAFNGNSDVSNITIDSCTVHSIGKFIINSSGKKIDSLSIHNSLFTGGLFKLITSANSSASITNSEFTGAGQLIELGIHNLEITDNDLGQVGAPWTQVAKITSSHLNYSFNNLYHTTYGTMHGVYLNAYNSGTSKFTVHNNVINMINGYNNPASSRSTNGLQIRMKSQDSCSILYNSIKIDMPNNDNNYGVALEVRDGFYEIKNNNISCTYERIPIMVHANTTVISDNNNIYTLHDTIAQIGNNYYTSISSLNADGYDSNSVSVDPYFLSDTLLIPYRNALHEAGTPITEITSDIVGTTRTNPPDIGAYQFNPIVFDVAIDSIAIDTLCAGERTVRAYVRNTSDSVVKKIAINMVTINLTSATSKDTVLYYNGSLAKNDTASFIVGSVDFVANTNFSILVSADTITGSGTRGYLDDDPTDNSILDTVSILSQPMPNYAVQKACVADSLVLRASGGVDYIWTLPNTTKDSSDTLIFVNPSAADTTGIRLTAFDSSGCSASINVQVALKPAVGVNLTADDTICSIETFRIKADSSTLNAYLWNNGETTPSILASEDTSFTYKITVTDQFNCIGSDSMRLTIYNNPVVSFSAAIPDACENGDSIVLTQGSPAGAGGVYTGTNVNSVTGKLGPGSFGIYPVTYSYTDSNGCFGTADTIVEINKVPSVSLSSIADVCINGGVDTITEHSPVDISRGRFFGNGIVNDSLGIFDPLTALTGANTIYYKYTNADGCSDSAFSSVTVNNTFAITFGAAATYCENAGKVTLSKPTGFSSSFSGYYTDTNTVSAVIGSHGFDPSIAGVGNRTLRYTVVNDKNCTSTANRVIRVDNVPVVTLSPKTYCVNTPELNLSGASPTGGSFIGGRGVNTSTGTTYIPDSAGVGLDTLVYTYSSGGCADTASAVYRIRTIPSVQFNLPAKNTERCIDAETFVLTGQSPVTGQSAGVGSFSGVGVDTNKFVAIDAGVGIHYIQYKYTDQFGCADSTLDTIQVHGLPSPTIISPFTNAVCLNRTTDSLIGSPPISGIEGSGMFRGVGIDTNGVFTASLVGVGLGKQIVYTFTDTNGCVNFETLQYRVDSVPKITLALIPDQCLNGAEYTFTQGSINVGNYAYKSGKLGLLPSAKYLPLNADTGSDTITYIFEDGLGCKDSLSQVISVLDTQKLTFSIPNSRAIVCENKPTFSLSSGTPNGGIYTGNGIIGNKFTAKNASIGSNIITYSFTDGNNCTSTITDEILVNAVTPVSFTNQSYCVNDGLTVLTNGTPSTGTYKYTGTGMINDTVFAPSVAGVGSKTLTYELTNSDGCVSQATAVFTINSVPSTQFGNQSAVCLNVPEFTLKGTSTSGDTSYFFNSAGLSNAQTGRYLPSLKGAGIDTVGYIGKIKTTGCADTVYSTILVHSLPNTALDTFPDLCLNNDPILLTGGNPKTGGTGVYSGTGVVGVQFYPSLAKVGSHQVVYKFTDNNNCSVSDTETVVVNGLPVLSPAVLNDLCQFDTAITLFGALPTGGYYQGVSVDSATSKFNPDTVGVFSIVYHYTDTNNCSNSISQTQRVRALPNTRLTFPNRFCTNANKVQLTGGSPFGVGGTYIGSGVSGNFYDPTIVTDTTDTLVYLFTDNFGCSSADSVVISFDNASLVSAIPLPEICKGTASLNLNPYFTPVGGKFSGANVFSGSFIANLLDTGRYSMSYAFTDSNNCTSTAYDTIVIRPLPSFTVSSDTGICQGDKIELVATGNYSYDWSNGDYLSSTQISPTKTSTYAVTATNAYNCITTKSVRVTVFDQITVYTSSTNATCGKPNGTAFTSVSGGTKPYNFVWPSGQRTSTARQLYAGNYQVTVNDKNGCTQYGVVGVSTEGGPEINLNSIVNNTCAGDENGEITVSITSDTSYSLKWNSGHTGTTLSGLPAGVYELSVIGDDGCNAYKSYEIKSPKAYEYEAIIGQPDCDSTNGSVYLVLANSLDKVTYSWLNQPQGDTLRAVGAGVYTAVVTNQSGCVDSVDIVLNSSFSPRIKLDSIGTVDCGKTNGFVAVSGVDLVSKFKWSTGDTTGILTGVAAGVYSVTASDTSGCSTVEQYEVEPTSLDAPVICTVTNDSLISANVISWDTTGSAADSFHVYRESSVKNKYFWLGTVSRNEAPRFEDKVLDNSTSIGTYAMSVVDVCGVETISERDHKSILLNTKQTDSSLIELTWSNYSGYQFGDYYVYRYSSQFGLQLLDSVNSINSYIDYSLPKSSSVLYYYIGIKGQTNCGDTGVTSISNLSRDYGRKITGTSEKVSPEVSFQVWPNPNNGTFQVKFDGISNENGSIVIYDMHGKIKYENEFGSTLLGSSQSIILSDVSSGLYYIQFIQNDMVLTKEIVISK